MQRITCLATCREFGGIVGCKQLVCPWKWNPSAKQTSFSSWTLRQPCNARRSDETRFSDNSLHNLTCRRQDALFVTQRFRQYSTDSGNEPKSKNKPDIDVVGIPDPITWIRNKFIILFIELYFDLNLSSVEFDTGVKQAVVYVSTMVSNGKFDDLNGVVSDEAVERIKKVYRGLSDDQRSKLAIASDDIIFVLPEDVSVIFDNRGRKFCYVMMRFWYLSSADVPDDPEGTRIFKISDNEDSSTKKILTAVYEFHRELTKGAEPDWTVTHMWHWKQFE